MSALRFLGFAVLLVGVTFKATSQTYSVSELHDLSELATGIQLGDSAAIYKAGQTGDSKFFIPVLRGRLKRSDNEGERDAIRMAMGKLGDTNTLQGFYCDAVKSLGLQVNPREIEYVGGGFWIRTLGALLDLDARFHKAKLPDTSDVRFNPPSYSALYELPRVVPKGPITQRDFLSPDEEQQAICVWKAWIASHEHEIDKMEPNGEGVVFSEKACRGWKIHRWR
jgi:hypothetical protein